VVFELSKVFGAWFGVGASSQLLSNTYAVRDKSLVSIHPCIEFWQGLLKVGRDIIIKWIAALAENEVLQKIEGSYMVHCACWWLAWVFALLMQPWQSIDALPHGVK
jgi:hypothetical protein